jgi:hypothetical protein
MQQTTNKRLNRSKSRRIQIFVKNMPLPQEVWEEKKGEMLKKWEKRSKIEGNGQYSM